MYLYFANKDYTPDVYNSHMLECVGTVGKVTDIIEFPLNVTVIRVNVLGGYDIYALETDVSVTDEDPTTAEFLPKWMMARINSLNAYQDISDRW